MSVRASRPALHFILGWLLALVFASATAQNFVPVPPLEQRVTDQAGMLKPEQRTALESVLRDYEERTGNQIAILTVSTTEPEVIEQYSIRVADAWKLGRKGVDDGVILLVAKDNPPGLRRLRIEAGRGVQGVLTDAQSKRILQDTIAPHFRQEDYYGGLAAGVSAITALLDQEKFAAPNRKPAAQAQDEGGSWLPFIFFGFFVLMAIFRSRRSRLNRHRWGRSSGIMMGGWGGGGWGGGGGGGWGGGGNGGGFSGGGGGFDGGGASGDW